MTDRNDIDQQLLTDTQFSYDHMRDSGRFKSYFKDDLDVPFWKCKEGDHYVDMIPYKRGKYDPKKPEGSIGRVLVVWVHYSVGTGQDRYICLSRTYGEPCPICERQNELRSQDEYDEDLVISLSPSRRTIYNILCYDNDKEEDKGIQIWEVSYKYSEENLLPLAHNPRKGGIDINFASLKDGKQVSFYRKGMAQKNTKFLGWRFNDRDYKLPPELIDEAHPLDELVHKPTYDEVYNAFWGKASTKVAAVIEESTNEKSIENMVIGTEPKRFRRTALLDAKPNIVEESKVEKSKEENKCPHELEFGVDISKDHKVCNEVCAIWEDCMKDERRRKLEARQKQVAEASDKSVAGTVSKPIDTESKPTTRRFRKTN